MRHALVNLFVLGALMGAGCNRGVQQDTGTTDCEFNRWFPDADGDGSGNASTPASMVMCAEDRPHPQFVLTHDDCDDTKSSIHPGADEICDGIDQNCNGMVDEGLGDEIYLADTDLDGYGDPARVVGTSCDGMAQPQGSVVASTSSGNDCDDGNPDVHPGVTEVCNSADDNCDGLVDNGATDALTFYLDADLDGYGDGAHTTRACSLPPRHSTVSGDCNDNDRSAYPGADEICDTVDNDCDGLVDNSVDDAPTWYRDADSDSYGDDAQTTQACAAPNGYTARGGDCNDNSAGTKPGGLEYCDGQDNDCNGIVDDDPENAGEYYVDNDRDGVGSDATVLACSLMPGMSGVSGDCDDTRSDIKPGATETCDGADNDCDGDVDENVKVKFYTDSDQDGFGNPATSVTVCAHQAPAGSVTNNDDCNDGSAAIKPGATETCNNIDDNCDGIVDNDLRITFYADGDNDGFGRLDMTTDACTLPTGYADVAGDCNDTDGDINPDADEICDTIDNDCDGTADVDAIDAPSWHVDADEDGFGSMIAQHTLLACEQPDGYIENGTDCNDTRPGIYPGAPERCNNIDDDCDVEIDEVEDLMQKSTDFPLGATRVYPDGDEDGFGKLGSAGTLTCDTTPATGFALTADDCRDTRDDINPAADEICNGLDDDCDGTTDVDAIDAPTWYADADSDSFGDLETERIQCSQPSGFVANSDDCNDTAAAIRPGAIETCNTVDDDCDGSIDEEAVDARTYYADVDADGFGSASTGLASCEQPTGRVLNDLDCNDGNGDINPDATEVCDNADNDCDGTTDVSAEDAPTWYADGDLDGHGNIDVATAACQQPAGTVASSDDCNDTRSDIKPGAAETCDGLDQNCNGEVDEGAKTTFWLDGDADGFGRFDQTTDACTVPGGYAARPGDCNDGNGDINPDATEVCDNADNDCDGTADIGAEDAPTWYRDADSDSFGGTATLAQCQQPIGYVNRTGDCADGNNTVYPGAPERCNGADDDCDGEVDNDPIDPTTWYLDSDNDGYGDDSDVIVDCQQPTSYTDVGGDCNDDSRFVNPGIVEGLDWFECLEVAENPADCDAFSFDCRDGVDQDCDGDIDGSWHPADGEGDDDGDGVENDTECDDAYEASRPPPLELSSMR